MNYPVETEFTEECEMEPQKKKRKPSSICAVKGCLSKSGTGMSFFRIPKTEPKCSQWKKALGYIGNHKFANLTPEQCHSRIKICKLHFESNCFSSENRIHNLAIPTLFLNNMETELDDEFNEEIHVKRNNTFSDKVNVFSHPLPKASTNIILTKPVQKELNVVNVFQPSNLQMFTSSKSIPVLTSFPSVKTESIIELHPNQVGEACSNIIKTESDDSLDSTNFEPLPPNETFMKDQTTQTSIELTPILIIRPEKETNSDQNLNCNKISERETTYDDVCKFIENNYSTEACSLLKAQLDVLERKKETGERDLQINRALKHIRIKKV